MCRGFQQNKRDRLKIKAFYIRLSISNAPQQALLPDSLTLYYLPRISGSPLEINESKIRSDLPGFVTLHRVVSAGAIFGSRERVRASEGVRFEVYLRDEKVLKGIFRKGDEWKMDCECVLESEMVGLELKEAEVCVAVEEVDVAMSEKVEMVVKRKRRAKCFQGLEEIPEEREVEGLECGADGYRCCCCCCCSGGEEMKMGSDGGDCEEEESDEHEDGEEAEMEMEGVRWAVDVGIWMLCLGVGYLVSKASSKSLRRSRLLL